MDQKLHEFRESEMSLKHELGVDLRILTVAVSSWRCDSILVSYTRGAWFEK